MFGGLRKHEKTLHGLDNYVYLGLGSATLLQLAFFGESDPNSPWLVIAFGVPRTTKASGKFLLGQQSVQNTKTCVSYSLHVCRFVGSDFRKTRNGPVETLRDSGPGPAL